MSPEREQKLKSKYPDLYPDDFYFECEDGWYSIIHALSWCLSGDTHGHVHDVTEKFGGLRFYATPKTPAGFAMIELTERLSVTLCESCGRPGRLASRGGCWVKTQCESCAAERGFEFNG